MCVFCGQPGQLQITIPAADMSGKWKYDLFSLVISILIKLCGHGDWSQLTTSKSAVSAVLVMPDN